MSSQIPNIEQLIGSLSTEDGRAVATMKALEKGLRVSDELRMKAILYAARLGEHDKALRWCANAEEAERLLGHYYSKPTAQDLEVRARAENLTDRSLSIRVVYSRISEATYKRVVEAFEFAGRYRELARLEEARENPERRGIYRALEHVFAANTPSTTR